MRSPSEEHIETQRKAIGTILGRIPSGVVILTAADADGRETGMLASWVQQASFEPPMVTVALNQKRYLTTWLDQSPSLALSLIGEAQKKILGHFGRGFEPGEPAFEGINISRGVTGLPVLSDAMGYLEGNIANRIEAGDHMIYVVQIVGAGSEHDLENHKPMVHIRKNGFKY